MIKHLAFKVVLDEGVGMRHATSEELVRRGDVSLLSAFFRQIGQGCLCFYLSVLDAIWLWILMFLIDFSCLLHSFSLNCYIAFETGR